jgi:hypothetical protein
MNAPARTSNTQARHGGNNAQSGTSHSQTRGNRTQARSNNSQTRQNNAQANGTNTNGSTTGGNSSGTRSGHLSATNTYNTMHPFSGTNSPYNYTYGSGAGARSYAAYGYGRGYRNGYYGSRYGYGRSQSMNRGIVQRLRSVHASLSRLNQDYQGHRSRAMQSISMAVRQLSHQSGVYSGVGFAPGMNNGARMNNGAGMGMGGRRSGLGGNGMRMAQGQSDAIMSQALRNLQGIGMQLANQGNNTMGSGRALGHVQRAAHELNVALSVR